MVEEVAFERLAFDRLSWEPEHQATLLKHVIAGANGAGATLVVRRIDGDEDKFSTVMLNAFLRRRVEPELTVLASRRVGLDLVEIVVQASAAAPHRATKLAEHQFGEHGVRSGDAFILRHGAATLDVDGRAPRRTARDAGLGALFADGGLGRLAPTMPRRRRSASAPTDQLERSSPVVRPSPPTPQSSAPPLAQKTAQEIGQEQESGQEIGQAAQASHPLFAADIGRAVGRPAIQIGSLAGRMGLKADPRMAVRRRVDGSVRWAYSHDAADRIAAFYSDQPKLFAEPQPHPTGAKPAGPDSPVGGYRLRGA